MAFKINLGSLSVQIGADTEGFEQGQKKVQKELKKTDVDLRKSANDFAKWGAAATAAATVAVAALTKANLSAIRELQVLAGTANTTVAEFERGAFAANQFGIETEKYGQILTDTNDRIGDFLTTGGGPMIDFFEQVAPKVGITADAFRGLSGQQAMGLYVDSLQKANLSQEEMTFFMEAMASDSTRLLPLFKDNAKALGEMSDEAKQLGIGLSDIDVAAVEMANKELAKISGIFGTIGKEIAVKLAPMIAAISSSLVDASKDAGGFGDTIGQVMNFAQKAVGVFANGVHGIKIIFQGVEVIARGFIMAVSVGLESLVNDLQNFGKSVARFVIDPLLSALEIASKFSSSAAAGFSELKNATKGLYEEPTNQLSDFSAAQIDALARSKEALHSMLAEKIPSEQIDAFVLDVNKKFQESIKKNPPPSIMGGSTGEATGPTQAEREESERIRLETEKILEALIEQGQAKEETILGNLAREQAILEEALQKKKITQEQFDKSSEALTKKTEDAKVNAVSQGLGAITAALTIAGKKNSKITKAFALGDAVVKGYEAATSAWAAGMKVGGPWTAAAFTAASLAKTGALIKSIKSSGKSQSSSGGSGIPAASNQGQAAQAQGQQQQSLQAQSPRKVQVEITGEGALTDFIRNLIMPGINEAIGDGFEII